MIKYYKKLTGRIFIQHETQSRIFSPTIGEIDLIVNDHKPSYIYYITQGVCI